MSCSADRLKIRYPQFASVSDDVANLYLGDFYLSHDAAILGADLEMAACCYVAHQIIVSGNYASSIGDIDSIDKSGRSVKSDKMYDLSRTWSDSKFDTANVPPSLMSFADTQPGQCYISIMMKYLVTPMVVKG